MGTEFKLGEGLPRASPKDEFGWRVGGVVFRHSDWLGSSRLASTTSRTIYYDGAYAPFGEPYAQSGTTDLSFTGQNQDTVAGLYDFPAREYSYQGRWPSPDPAGLAAVDPSNPQSWNRYAYVLNNPMNSVDPLGLCGGGPGANGDPCAPFSYVDANGCTVYVTYHTETDSNGNTWDIPDQTTVCDGGCPLGWSLDPRQFGQPQCTPGHQLGDNPREPRDRRDGLAAVFTAFQRFLQGQPRGGGGRYPGYEGPSSPKGPINLNGDPVNFEPTPGNDWLQKSVYWLGELAKDIAPGPDRLEFSPLILFNPCQSGIPGIGINSNGTIGNGCPTMY